MQRAQQRLLKAWSRQGRGWGSRSFGSESSTSYSSSSEDEGQSSSLLQRSFALRTYAESCEEERGVSASSPQSSPCRMAPFPPIQEEQPCDSCGKEQTCDSCEKDPPDAGRQPSLITLRPESPPPEPLPAPPQPPAKPPAEPLPLPSEAEPAELPVFELSDNSLRKIEEDSLKSLSWDQTPFVNYIPEEDSLILMPLERRAPARGSATSRRSPPPPPPSPPVSPPVSPPPSPPTKTLTTPPPTQISPEIDTKMSPISIALLKSNDSFWDTPSERSLTWEQEALMEFVGRSDWTPQETPKAVSTTSARRKSQGSQNVSSLPPPPPPPPPPSLVSILKPQSEENITESKHSSDGSMSPDERALLERLYVEGHLRQSASTRRRRRTPRAMPSPPPPLTRYGVKSPPPTPSPPPSTPTSFLSPVSSAERATDVSANGSGTFLLRPADAPYLGSPSIDLSAVVRECKRWRETLTATPNRLRGSPSDSKMKHNVSWSLDVISPETSHPPVGIEHGLGLIHVLETSQTPEQNATASNRQNEDHGRNLLVVSDVSQEDHPEASEGQTIEILVEKELPPESPVSEERDVTEIISDKEIRTLKDVAELLRVDSPERMYEVISLQISSTEELEDSEISEEEIAATTLQPYSDLRTGSIARQEMKPKESLVPTDDVRTETPINEIVDQLLHLSVKENGSTPRAQIPYSGPIEETGFSALTDSGSSQRNSTDPSGQSNSTRGLPLRSYIVSQTGERDKESEFRNAIIQPTCAKKTSAGNPDVLTPSSSQAGRSVPNESGGSQSPRPGPSTPPDANGTSSSVRRGPSCRSANRTECRRKLRSSCVTKKSEGHPGERKPCGNSPATSVPCIRSTCPSTQSGNITQSSEQRSQSRVSDCASQTIEEWPDHQTPVADAEVVILDGRNRRIPTITVTSAEPPPRRNTETSNGRGVPETPTSQGKSTNSNLLQKPKTVLDSEWCERPVPPLSYPAAPYTQLSSRDSFYPLPALNLDEATDATQPSRTCEQSSQSEESSQGEESTQSETSVPPAKNEDTCRSASQAPNNQPSEEERLLYPPCLEPITEISCTSADNVQPSRLTQRSSESTAILNYVCRETLTSSDTMPATTSSDCSALSLPRVATTSPEGNSQTVKFEVSSDDISVSKDKSPSPLHLRKATGYSRYNEGSLRYSKIVTTPSSRRSESPRRVSARRVAHAKNTAVAKDKVSKICSTETPPCAVSVRHTSSNISFPPSCNFPSLDTDDLWPYFWNMTQVSSKRSLPPALDKRRGTLAKGYAPKRSDVPECSKSKKRLCRVPSETAASCRCSTPVPDTMPSRRRRDRTPSKDFRKKSKEFNKSSVLCPAAMIALDKRQTKRGGRVAPKRIDGSESSAKDIPLPYFYKATSESSRYSSVPRDRKGTLSAKSVGGVDSKRSKPTALPNISSEHSIPKSSEVPELSSNEIPLPCFLKVNSESTRYSTVARERKGTSSAKSVGEDEPNARPDIPNEHFAPSVKSTSMITSDRTVNKASSEQKCRRYASSTSSVRPQPQRETLLKTRVPIARHATTTSSTSKERKPSRRRSPLSRKSRHVHCASAACRPCHHLVPPTPPAQDTLPQPPTPPTISISSSSSTLSTTSIETDSAEEELVRTSTSRRKSGAVCTRSDGGAACHCMEMHSPAEALVPPTAPQGPLMSWAHGPGAAPQRATPCLGTCRCPPIVAEQLLKYAQLAEKAPYMWMQLFVLILITQFVALVYMHGNSAHDAARGALFGCHSGY